MKEKITNLFNKMNPWFDKLGANPYLQAVSGAMMATLGPLFIGSMSVLIVVLMGMVPALAKLNKLTELLTKVNTMTLGALAVYIAVLIAYHW